MFLFLYFSFSPFFLFSLLWLRFFSFSCFCFYRFFTFGQVKGNARYGRSRHQPKILQFVKLILRPERSQQRAIGGDIIAEASGHVCISPIPTCRPSSGPPSSCLLPRGCDEIPRCHFQSSFDVLALCSQFPHLFVFCKRRVQEEASRWPWTSCDMCATGGRERMTRATQHTREKPSHTHMDGKKNCRTRGTHLPNTLVGAWHRR